MSLTPEGLADIKRWFDGINKEDRLQLYRLYDHIGAQAEQMARKENDWCKAILSLRRWINGRLQTAAISEERARAPDRHTVAECRQSDVETLRAVIEQIDLRFEIATQREGS